MKLPTALIIACTLLASAHTPAQQTTAPPSKTSTKAKKPNLVDELAQAQQEVDRFMLTFKSTRDITPLIEEMFTSDFKHIIETDPSWSGTVGVGRSLLNHLNEEDRLKCFIAAFNLRYMFRLAFAGKILLTNAENAKTDDFVSPEVADFFKRQSLPEEMVETSEQAQKHLAFLESAVLVMRKELDKNPPEATATFDENLVAYAAHIKAYKEVPAIRVLESPDKWGHPKGTLMANFRIPFHVALLLIKENGKYKIWLAMTDIPPD